MSNTTAAQGARGGAIVVLGSAATAVLQFTSVVVLSRLIAPGDFGLIAMVTVFLSLASLIRDFGMPLAALQARDLTKQQESNFFWVNTATAAITGTALVLSTPLVVLFYSEPRLKDIIPFMGLAILITGVGAQLQVQLARGMRYKALVTTELGSQGVALIVAVVLAAAGFGYWALVAQTVIAAALLLALRWLATRWRPLRFRRGHESAALLKSGARYGLASLLTFLQNNADTLIIGARLGTMPLGIYNRAYQILTVPAARLMSPLTQVVVPTINKLQKEGTSYASPLLQIQFTLGAVGVWIFSVTAGAADELIPLVLGPGWERTIPVFRVLALGGFFMVLSQVSYWGFIVNQQSQQLLRYNLVTKPLSVLLILAGSTFGLTGIAVGYATGLAISWPINILWLSKSARLPGWEFIRGGLGVVLAGTICGSVVWLTQSHLRSLTVWLSLPAATLLGSAIFVACLAATPISRKKLMGSLTLVRQLTRRS